MESKRNQDENGDKPIEPFEGTEETNPNHKKRAFQSFEAISENPEESKKQKQRSEVDVPVSSFQSSNQSSKTSEDDDSEQKPDFVKLGEENCSSALSSACSSPVLPPSSPLHPSSGAASTASSVSSSSSYLKCPPPPPTTPISENNDEACNFHSVATPKPSSPLTGLPEIPTAEDMRAPSSATSQSHQRDPKQTEKMADNKKLEISDDFNSWNVTSRYELMRILGRGSYGEVAQAKDLHMMQPNSAPKYVAIKRISTAFQQEVDALRLFREIHLLKRLRGHDCIIQLIDIEAPGNDNDINDLYLVFEYVDTDLYKLIMSPQYLTTPHIRTFLCQMLKGLKFLHASSMIHRDLKPANILLNEDCSLKICDFGLARIIDSSQVAKNSDVSSDSSASTRAHTKKNQGLTRQLTKHVVTRWYRAPELILIQPYTTAVDIWSVGCIFAELLSMQEGSVPSYEDRVPLFPGGSCFPLSGDSTTSEERLDQLSVIFGVIGSPSEKDIECLGSANGYIKTLKKSPRKSLESVYPAADPQGLDLLKKMLQFNPAKRCTADEALKHPFFEGLGEESNQSTNNPNRVHDDGSLVGPDFLNSDKISIKEIKKCILEEVSWFKGQELN